MLAALSDELFVCLRHVSARDLVACARSCRELRRRLRSFLSFFGSVYGRLRPSDEWSIPSDAPASILLSSTSDDTIFDAVEFLLGGRATVCPHDNFLRLATVSFTSVNHACFNTLETMAVMCEAMCRAMASSPHFERFKFVRLSAATRTDLVPLSDDGWSAVVPIVAEFCQNDVLRLTLHGDVEVSTRAIAKTILDASDAYDVETLHTYSRQLANHRGVLAFYLRTSVQWRRLLFSCVPYECY